MQTEDLTDRKKFIGSSDIAAVMGLSRWTTPLQLWAVKTGRLEPDDLSELEYVQLGTELEDFVAQKFQRETNLKVRRTPKRYVHADFPYMVAQVDRIIEGTNELLECKTCSAWKAKEWEGEEIPQEYILQVMWQLGIAHRSVGHIAVLIGGQAFKYKRMNADLELFDKMVLAAVEFDKMVKNDTPPIAVGEDNYIMVDLHPESDEQIQEVEELNDKIGLLQQLKGNIKTMKEEQDKFEAEIKQTIGDNLGIKTSEYKVTWKSQVTKRVDNQKLKDEGIYEKYLKESETRVLRVKKEEHNVNARKD